MNIFVAGHNGMVGSAIVRKLKNDSNNKIITASRDNLNLLDQSKVESFFKLNKIDQVYLAAAKVGGIYSNNKYRADFIYENLTIQNNVINSAHKYDVNKLLFLGSSCIYPKFADQPIKESALLSDCLEYTNEPYAIAKIAGIKMCESYFKQYQRDYRSIMPTNLYGPKDNFHGENSHVIPALIKKFHLAIKNDFDEVEIWGSGKPKREFLHVDDMADASIYVMNKSLEEMKKLYNKNLYHLNVGTGEDVTIKELAKTIKSIFSYDGKLKFNTEFPDGTPRKLLDVSKLSSMGWKHSIDLHDGLEDTIQWYLENTS